ncbi:hypothetical protein ACPPVT_07430 [Angustibacter sp. McL0619]|uniref:hypothetical protein n=1 Tax=Angustibacter sp. McL0619 TaxID=3415676 RepID=UPI003CF8237E
MAGEPILLHPGDPRLDRRAEDAIFLSALVAVSGVSQLATGQVAGSVDTLLSRVLTIGWALSLIAFGGLTFGSICWPNPSTGVLLERAGRRGLAGSCAVYAIAALTVFGLQSLFAATLTLAYGFACYRRQRRITKWLHWTIEDLERHP